MPLFDVEDLMYRIHALAAGTADHGRQASLPLDTGAHHGRG
jgi:hypothetical protein